MVGTSTEALGKCECQTKHRVYILVVNENTFFSALMLLVE